MTLQGIVTDWSVAEICGLKIAVAIGKSMAERLPERLQNALAVIMSTCH